MIRSILLLCFFSGLLFRASLAHAEEGREEVQGSPLMMMRGGKPVDPSEHQKASKEERDRSDEEQCEQGERFSATETLADQSREDLSVMSIEEENTQDGDRNPLHSDNQSEKAPPAAPLYRLIGKVWNVKNRQTKEFEPTGRFDSLRRTVIDSVSRVDFLSLLPAELLGLCHNRAGDIEKKRIAYQEELAILHPDSIQAKRLKVLDPLFQKAASYQNEINGRLIDAIKKAPEKPGRRYFLLKIIEEINSRPNQVERLIEQIEEDYQKLTRCQERSSEIEAEMVALQNRGENILPIWNQRFYQARDAVRQSIGFYDRLIALRVVSAKLIRLPYEESIDQKSEREKKVIVINLTALAARYDYLLAVTRLYELRSDVSPLMRHELSCLSASSEALQYAAIELQRAQPRQKIVDRLLLSIELNQQAEDVLNNATDPDRESRARYLNSAARAICAAAYETDRETWWAQQQQNSIDLYLRAAEFYQQAVTALDHLENPDRKRQADYFNNVAESLYREAKRT